jgi:hypothetical protein
MTKMLIQDNKNILIAAIALSLTACAGSFKRNIFSPSSKDGAPLWYQHVHGGALTSSPPDGLYLQVKNDTANYLIIFSEPISARLTSIGFLFPIIPMFWSNYHPYGEEKVRISCYSNLKLSSEQWNGLFALVTETGKFPGRLVPQAFHYIGSNRIMVGLKGERARAYRHYDYASSAYIQFDVKKSELNSFHLSIQTLMFGKLPVSFSEVTYTKAIQKTRVAGP